MLISVFRVNLELICSCPFSLKACESAHVVNRVMICQVLGNRGEELISKNKERMMAWPGVRSLG